MAGEVISKKKILLFSHSVTLAHFVRPLRWIECLDKNLYDIYLASSETFLYLVPKTGVTFVPIKCIDPVKFSKIVEQAEFIYDAETFSLHIEEDLTVIEKIKPDLIIGDFRHSLSVSCRLKKIRYINLTNAYWSPDIKLPYPIPEAPFVRYWGEKWYGILFHLITPILTKYNFFLMAYEIRGSLKRVHLKFYDYRSIISDGDIALFCDTPALVPLNKKLGHEVFLGPLTWSMPNPLPDWWETLNQNKRWIFIGLGSSGDINLLPMIVSTLAKLDAEIIVATSGRNVDLDSHSNVHTLNFLPLEKVIHKFALVIGNGGSPIVHSALNGGVPSLGIVCNNDQLLNMVHIEKRGAGLMLRNWNITSKSLLSAVNRIFIENSFQVAAKLVQKEFQGYNVPLLISQITADNCR